LQTGGRHREKRKGQTAPATFSYLGLPLNVTCPYSEEGTERVETLTVREGKVQMMGGVGRDEEGM